MKHTYIDVTDQFCGVGGSSQGVRNISKKNGGGAEVKLALNHWKLAIETHNTNFPEALHDCTDISASDPRRYPSTTILITSPECTNHTLAKGVKRVKSQIDLFNTGKLDPAADRSRATMWDVPRFAEYHKYELIFVENVVDAREWVMFPAWLESMHLLGYKHKCVYLNSMFCYPTPQSRDRMYIVFWKKGNKEPRLEFMPAAHCPKCNADIKAIQRWKNNLRQFGKNRKQYTYVCPVCATEVVPYFYAAFNCIDWSDIGTRIGDRKTPLSENTVRRIEYGLKKYGTQSLVIHAKYGKEARGTERTIMDPMFTQTTVDSQAIVHPFVVNDQQSTGIGFRVKGIEENLSTIATAHRMSLVTPFILKEEHAGEVRSMVDPLSTQTTRQSMGLVSPESWKSFLTYFYGQSQASGMNEPTGSVTTKDRFAIVNYQEPKVEDCYFRMLRPHEIKLAMAFDKNYTVLGSQKDQVKQLGNAVTPPAMEWLVERGIESLQS